MSDDPFEGKVYEGPAADAVLVKLALERDGIRCHLVDTHVRPLYSAVCLVEPAQAARARMVIGRHLKGSSPSEAALAQPWQCPSCGETIEGQFQACWNCGHAKL